MDQTSLYVRLAQMCLEDVRSLWLAMKFKDHAPTILGAMNEPATVGGTETALLSGDDHRLLLQKHSANVKRISKYEVSQTALDDQEPCYLLSMASPTKTPTYNRSVVSKSSFNPSHAIADREMRTERGAHIRTNGLF